MLHNKYIYSGFRQTSSSWWDFSKSIFRMHNETLNVWSHLLGFVCFGVILYHTIFYLGWETNSSMVELDGMSNALAAANEALRQRRSEWTSAMIAGKDAMTERLEWNGTEKLIAALLHRGLLSENSTYGFPETYSLDELYGGLRARRAAAEEEWQKVKVSTTETAERWKLNTAEAAERWKANTAEAAERLKANTAVAAERLKTNVENGQKLIQDSTAEAAERWKANVETGRQAAEAAWRKVKDSTAEAAECWSDKVEQLEIEVEASYRMLSHQLGMLPHQEPSESSDEPVKRPIDQLIRSLRLQNTTITLRAAETLEKVASFNGAGGASIVPMMVFVISAMICLGASTACHLYYAMSYGTSLTMSRVDFTGITCLIAGSFFPVVFYGLHCSVFWQRIYICGVVLMAACIISMLMNERMAGTEYANYRTAMFIGLGFIGVFPVSHHFAIYGMTPMIMHLLGMAALYLTGTVFYVLKIPERWYPGCFDYVGNSHLWWHIFVLLAALVHYRGSMAAYEMMQDSPDDFCNAMAA